MSTEAFCVVFSSILLTHTLNNLVQTQETALLSVTSVCDVQTDQEQRR